MNEQAPRRPVWGRPIVLWTLALVLAVLFYGPQLVRNLQPTTLEPLDFYQEYASGRFFFDGKPVYSPLEPSVEEYLGIRLQDVSWMLKLNAHPPTSVLLALPLAGLTYQQAFLAWNLVSLAALLAAVALMARQLEVRPAPWWVVPGLVLLLVCYPLQEQIMQGQLNLFLLLLIVGTWAAERSDRPRLAGFLLATACVLKIYPTFLLLPFLIRRRWKLLASATLTGLGWTALTLAILGPSTYGDYVHKVMPHVTQYYNAHNNLSLTGFWHKVAFAAHLLRLSAGSAWVRPAAAICSLAVVAIVTWVCLRARGRSELDSAFALAVCALPLLSPITWAHGFLLLLLPMALFYLALPSQGWPRVAFWTCLALLLLPHPDLWRAAFHVLDRQMEARVGGRVSSFPIVILHFAGLFTLFTVAVSVALRSTRTAQPGEQIQSSAA